MPVLKFWKFFEPQPYANYACSKNWDFVLNKHTGVALMSIPARIRTHSLQNTLVWQHVILSTKPNHQLLKISHKFFSSLTIGNSSEIFGHFQTGTSSHLYQRLPLYVPNWQCDQRDSFEFFLYVSLPHKPVEHEFIHFHSFNFIHLWTRSVKIRG